MASSGSRYVVELPPGNAFIRCMIGTWKGSEEEHDGLSVQEETLELEANGTFRHQVGHNFALGNSGRRGERSGSSSEGSWRLVGVKNLGADVDAVGDHELHFEGQAGGPAPLVRKLVVCGANPRVNGFLGYTCRLYPSKEPRAAAENDVEEDDVEEAVEFEEDEEAEGEEERIEIEPDEAAVQQIAEVTGRSLDECLAALLEENCNTEAAISRLLDNDSQPQPARAVSSSQAGPATVSSTMAEVL
ncbi:unnamed protein product, partial [Polarella glacialis]